jgi:glycosyltransferase involved in cell wall biosynthesis
VDVDHFTPAADTPAGGPVLLLGGDQTQEYRLALGLRTFAQVLASEPSARLLVTGRLVSSAEPLVEELGLRDRVEFLGRYSQREAPAIMQRAHLLLHTKVQDPCPSVVIEAMACGLPVVYPASGGTVELVEDEAGVGVPHPVGWERDQPPAAEDLAAAVLRVLGDRERYSQAARRRAVERFDVRPWLDRHAELFHQLLAKHQPR